MRLRERLWQRGVGEGRGRAWRMKGERPEEIKLEREVSKNVETANEGERVKIEGERKRTAGWLCKRKRERRRRRNVKTEQRERERERERYVQ